MIHQRKSNKNYWSIRRNNEFWPGAEFVPAKAEDTGGLLPVKDDNAGGDELCPRQSMIFRRMDHYAGRLFPTEGDSRFCFL